MPPLRRRPSHIGSKTGSRLRPVRVLRLAAAIAAVTLCALGCAGNGAPPSVSAAPPDALRCSPPEWTVQGAARSDAFEHGVGTAEDPERARRLALENLVGRLSTFVESNTVDRLAAVDGVASESLQQEIRTRVAGTRVEGWEQTRLEERCGSYWVEVRVEREQLVRSARSELDRLAQDLDLRLESSRGSALRELMALRRTAPSRERATSLVSLISVLDPTFDHATWKQRRARWRRTDETARRTLVFEIRSDDDSRELAGWVESLLVSKRLRTRTGSCMPSDAVCVDIRSVVKEDYVAGRHIAQIRSTLAILGSDGSVIRSTKLEAFGKSRSDRALARRDALDQLERRVRGAELLDELI